MLWFWNVSLGESMDQSLFSKVDTELSCLVGKQTGQKKKPGLWELYWQLHPVKIYILWKLQHHHWSGVAETPAPQGVKRIKLNWFVVLLVAFTIHWLYPLLRWRPSNKIRCSVYDSKLYWMMMPQFWSSGQCKYPFIAVRPRSTLNWIGCTY